MPPLFQHVITLIARIMISLYFIVTGGLCIANWGSRSGAIGDKLAFLYGTMGEAGIAVVSNVLLVAAIIVTLVGGLSVLIGLRARAGAVLLIIFLVPNTLIMHNFWASAGSMHDEIAVFLKNVALLGGVLMIFAFGAGGMSADLMLPRRRKAGEF